MSLNSKPGIYIGTSGWSYDHWRAAFYPENISKEHMLDYYLQQFNSVELNNTFYRLPQNNTFKKWRNAAPKGFVFTVKASRYITHMKKLKDPKKSVSEFMRRISTLGDALGPVLFQLPPHWKFNPERLKVFLQSLSYDYQYVFEFRDHSWINTQTYELLSQHNAAFCIYELNGYLSPKTVTSNFIYIRLHGPKGPYQGNYTDTALSGWAKEIITWKKQGYTIFCYFDNDQAGYAANNAKSLCGLLDLNT